MPLAVAGSNSAFGITLGGHAWYFFVHEWANSIAVYPIAFMLVIANSSSIAVSIL